MPDVESSSDQPISIDRLHVELLWSIFILNADVHDNSPLETARHTSQVCNLWRKIMLTAPTIWGKSLALYELQIQKDLSPWRDLVMERTASAPLFIKGDMPVSCVEWFLEFISPHWERICEINVYLWGPPEKIDEEKAKFLNTPPLSIRAFHLPRVQFDLQASWVANLRSLGLSTPFTATEILTCVANMPRLEDANFDRWTPAAIPSESFPLDPRIRPIRPGKIPLPHLINLQLYHSLSEVTEILDHITPNEQCAYRIETMEDSSSNDARWDILFGYIERRINLRDEITLRLDVGRHFIMFRIVGDPSTPALIYDHSIDCLQNPDNAVGVLLSRFYLRNTPGGTGLSPRNLMSSKVTALAIHIDDDCYRGIMDRSIKNFTDFCLSFPSVSQLELSLNSLVLLCHIVSESVVFPSLETLKVSTDGQQHDPAFDTLVAEFLNSRRSYGKPITKLWFHPNVMELRLDWGFLEDFCDMKVSLTWLRADDTYGESVYICGSGNPERLDMRNGWEGLVVTQENN